MAKCASSVRGKAMATYRGLGELGGCWRWLALFFRFKEGSNYGELVQRLLKGVKSCIEIM